MSELVTPRLVLIAATRRHIEAELQGRSALQSMLGASIPEDWPPGEYDREAQEYFLSRLSTAGEFLVGWLTWYAVTRTAAGGRDALIAGAGFFGPPSDGAVEIGYSVVPAARGRGHATEIVRALSSFAFSHEAVNVIVAHAHADNTPSWRALLRCGFTQAPSSSRPGTVEYTLQRPLA